MRPRELRTFRKMAEQQGLIVRRPRQRWRHLVRFLARREGWGYADAFLHVMYGESTALMDLFLSRTIAQAAGGETFTLRGSSHRA